MKKTFKNYNVEIQSDKNLKDKEITLGVGQLKKSKKTFYFETVKHKPRNENPLVYEGCYFRVRSSKTGFRFTAIISLDDIEKLNDATVSCEIEKAISNIKSKFASC